MGPHVATAVVPTPTYLDGALRLSLPEGVYRVNRAGFLQWTVEPSRCLLFLVDRVSGMEAVAYRQIFEFGELSVEEKDSKSARIN